MTDWTVVKTVFEQGVSFDDLGRKSLLAHQTSITDSEAQLVKDLWDNIVESEAVIQPDAIASQAFEAFLEESQASVQQDPQIENYEIIEKIGCGSFSTVWLANQKEPFRQVAIKVLEVPLHSSELISRFQREQQVLAILSHPYIASIYECGLTDDGCPFFSMEYLHGLPITRWCEEHHLNRVQRLDLFKEVCSGMLYAHQKGVIHRDLKPDHIFIVEQGGKVVPKIIDFGIAKLTEVPGDRSLFNTQLRKIMGTPNYMSPEQATGNQNILIDTRSDVYSLGAILYELMTGLPPLGQELEKAGSLQSVLRIIENEIPAPLKQYQGRKTRNRLGLGHAGDLDLIVFKALEKKPANRYASCSELGEDIDRFLQGEPIFAKGLTPSYLLRMFVMKHIRVVSIASIFLLVIIVGLISTSLAMTRALRAEAQAMLANSKTEDTLERLEAVHRFTTGIFQMAEPSKYGGDVTGKELLIRASEEIETAYSDQPTIEAATRMVLGHAFEGLGVYDRAEKHYEGAFKLRKKLLGSSHDDTLESKLALAHLLNLGGDFNSAEKAYYDTYMVWRERYGTEDARSLRAASGLALAWKYQVQFEKAQSMFKVTLKGMESVFSPHHSAYLAAKNNYANLLVEMNDLETADTLFSEVFAARKSSLGEEHPLTLGAQHNLAHVLQLKGNLTQAQEIYQIVYDSRKKKLGPHHPKTLMTLNNLATIQNSPENALQLLEPVWESELEMYPATLMIGANLGHFLQQTKQYQKAERVLLRVIAGMTEHMGRHDRTTLRTRCTLTEVHLAQGGLAQAESRMGRILTDAETTLGKSDEDTHLYRGMLGYIKFKMGKKEVGKSLIQSSLEHLGDSPFGKHIYELALGLGITTDPQRP